MYGRFVSVWGMMAMLDEVLLQRKNERRFKDRTKLIDDL